MGSVLPRVARPARIFRPTLASTMLELLSTVGGLLRQDAGARFCGSRLLVAVCRSADLEVSITLRPLGKDAVDVDSSKLCMSYSYV
jgi:hypothetical protein